MRNFHLSQEEALTTLICLAPTWYHSIERRLEYIDQNQHERWVIFTSPSATNGEVKYFKDSNLDLALAAAKKHITFSLIEIALCH